jgi:DNA repair/transcription protein MET18/MMS19
LDPILLEPNEFSANMKQVEVFKTIEEGVKSYSIPTVSLAAPKLWDSLKFEVWNGENEDFIQPSLNVLKQMASSLDKSRWEWLENDNPVNTFVIAALAECKQRIQDKQSTYLGPCGRIFNAIASASPHAFYLVVRFMLPVLDTLWQAHTSGPEKVLVLGVLNGILRARLVQVDVVPLPEAEFAALSPEMQEYQHMSESHMTNGFNEFRDRIIEMYHEDVTRVMENTELSEEADSYGVPAIQGLVLIFSIPYYLSDAEKGMMAGELVEITLKRDQIGDIQAESLSALGQISGMEPNLFQKIVLPAIMDKLPEKLSSEPEQQELELSSAISYLEDLVQIVSTSSSSSSTASYRQHNFTAMQEKIVEKLGETMLHKGQLRFQHALLAAASAWFESSKGDDTRPAGGPLRDLQRFREEGQFGGPILQLFQKVVQPKEHISDPVLGYTGLADVGDNLDDKFIQLVGEYAMRALRDDSTTEENNFLTTWDRSHPDEPSAIWTLFTKNTRPDSLASSQPNLLSAPADKCLANALSMYLIAGTRREVS